jgi:hypothetical protein
MSEQTDRIDRMLYRAAMGTQKCCCGADIVVSDETSTAGKVKTDCPRCGCLIETDDRMVWH